MPAHAREPTLPLHGPPSDALAAMVQARAEGAEALWYDAPVPQPNLGDADRTSWLTHALRLVPRWPGRG